MRRPRFLLLALANFLAIAAWFVWGLASSAWYFEGSGGSPAPHEIVKWCLIFLNAPAFLVVVAVTAPLGLGLFRDYVAMNSLWALATVPVWLAYPLLLRPAVRLVRNAAIAGAVVFLGAAGWALTVAWHEGHDPGHSCWSVLALVSMLLGMSFVAAAPAMAGMRRAQHI